MNVCSLELSKQLYKVSEWKATGSVLQYWVYQPTIDSKRRDKRDLWRLENIMRINEDYGVTAILDTDSFIPAYDLGYLRSAILEGLNKTILSPDKFESIIRQLKEALLAGEYATAYLAIELFKQRILTRKGDE